MPKDELKEAMKNVDGGVVSDDDKQVIVDAAAEIKAEKDLEKNVQEKLDGLGLDPDKSSTDEEDEDTEENGVGEEDDTNTDEDTEDKNEDTEDKDKEKTDDATSEGKEKTDDNTLTLPAEFMQTAVRLGMSEKEVKDNFDKNPEFMISALGELHKGENGLSAQYSQMGRAIQEKQIAAQKNTSDDDDTSPESFVDIKKLKAQYEDGDEEMLLIDKVIKPLNDALGKLSKQVNSQVQPDSQPAYSQQEDRAIHSEINNFFDNDNLKPFRDYYGTVKPGEDPRIVLTGAQFKHRNEVCTEGSLIRTGADFAGKKLAISDVLHRAHLQLTESMRAEMIRENLSAKIKTRGKGISIKAGKRQTSDNSKEKDPEKQLESDTAKRLKAIKW